MRILNSILALLCLVLTAQAQTATDNIVISDATCQYWPVAADDGTLRFKNKTQTTYLAERMGGWVEPAIYYGNDITLDSYSAGLGNVAQFKSIEPPGVFYGDMRVCYYQLYLSRKGKKATARFERTFNDCRFVDCIFLDDDYLTRHKRLEITLPKGYRLEEYNLNEHISKQQYTDAKGNRIVSYTITDQPAARQEQHMPSALKWRPCVLLLGAFRDVSDLYTWSQQQSDVDCRVANIDSLLTAIATDATTKEERMRRTFAWVQSNIRYVAYEAGKASHRPDTPAEVLRKRYGDCKGMSLLLKTLLQAQGIDARLTYVGTDDIPWKPSDVPALVALNHVICIATADTTSYYLDPTTRFQPAEYVPAYLQGHEALMEDGTGYAVVNIPALSPSASTDSLRYDVTIGDRCLDIRAVASWSGTMKELILRSYRTEDTKDKGELTSRLLNADDRHRTVTRATWTADTCSAQWAVLEGVLTDPKAVITTGTETYVELDPHSDMMAMPIDTAQRVNDVELPFCCHTVREVCLTLPEGAQAGPLPKGTSIRLPQATLSCTFEQVGRSIVFRKVMTVHKRLIPRQQIPQWNAALRRWHNACSEQVILKR